MSQTHFSMDETNSKSRRFTFFFLQYLMSKTAAMHLQGRDLGGGGGGHGVGGGNGMLGGGGGGGLPGEGGQRGPPVGAAGGGGGSQTRWGQKEQLLSATFFQRIY